MPDYSISDFNAAADKKHLSSLTEGVEGIEVVAYAPNDLHVRMSEETAETFAAKHPACFVKPRNG